MPRRSPSVVLALVALAAIAGCAQMPSTVAPTAGAESEAPAVTTEQAPGAAEEEPGPAPGRSPQELLLTIDDLPTGGWAAEPSGGSPDVSSDSQSAGACALDMAGVLPETAPEDEAYAAFTRDSLSQRLTVGVFVVDDPAAAVDVPESAWSECPERTDYTSNGQDSSMVLSPYEGTPPGDAACRHFKLTAGYSRATGDLCFVAADRHLYVGMTMARYEHQAVDPSELDQVLAAQAALLQ